jgi:hypothetical protein
MFCISGKETCASNWYGKAVLYDGFYTGMEYRRALKLHADTSEVTKHSFTFSLIETSQVSLSQKFELPPLLLGVWSYIQALTLKYATEYGNVLVISGLIYDYDGDGKADSYNVIRQK